MRCAPMIMTLWLVVTGPVAGEEHKRQLGVHEHGHGFLNIAIEDNGVLIELQAPGSDIARTETKPNTPERKVVVEAAIATLEKPLELFRFPAEAGCEVTSAKATMAVIGEDEDGSHAGKGDHHDKQASEHEHAEGREGGEDHRGHSNYHGTYQLKCSAPQRLTGFELLYFKVFPRTEKLSLQIIGPNGQTQLEVTAATPRVSLAGAI